MTPKVISAAVYRTYGSRALASANASPGGLDHENSYSYFDSILRMDDLNSGWTQLALTLSTPRAINSAAVFGGEVFLVGGANGPSDNTGLLRIVESFNGTALTPRPDLIYATFLNEGGVLKTSVFA